MLIDSELLEEFTDSRRSALIVDGDPERRKSISRHLELMDFDVLSANHYDGAVHHLTTREFHFACVDVQLPSKSGYELCEHIRGSLGLLGLPILVTSESGQPEDMAYAEAAGGNAFLQKPFSMRDLARCVQSLLEATRWSTQLPRELQPLASRPQRPGYAARIHAPTQPVAHL